MTDSRGPDHGRSVLTSPALSALALIVVWLVATNVGPFSGDSITDLYVYGQYHDMLRDGLVPFKDFTFEYPPIALIPMWLSNDVTGRLSVEMLLCALACQRAAWALGGALSGWLMVLVPPVAGALIRTHFDMLPTAFAMAGLALIVTRRPARGGVELGFLLLGLGTMTKLWPVVIAAIAVVWLHGRGERRAAYRGAAIVAGVVLAIGVPFAAIGDFPGSMVRFHLDRPVQIESTAASVLEITGGSHVTGDPIRHDEFKSNGLDGGGAGAVALLSSLAMFATGLALLWLVWRRPGQEALILAALAITLAFICFSKVLSPQYVVWYLPLAACAATIPSRAARVAVALGAAASLVTQLWFPGHYVELIYQEAWVVVAVAVRNALLLAALGATALALARSPRPASASPSSAPPPR